MSGLVIDVPAATELHGETNYPDDTVTVVYRDDGTIVLEISTDMGAVVAKPDLEAARDIGGALIQVAERIEANREDDPSANP